MTVLIKKMLRVSLLCWVAIVVDLVDLQGENLNRQQKPYAASIFIDYEDELDIQQCSSITSNFSVHMYLQDCPILVIGPHMLLNIVKKIDLFRSKSNAWFKFCIIFKKKLIDFDKNWLVFQMPEKKMGYLIFPRKFIEYYFNIKFGDLKASMSDKLISFCKQSKVIAPSGKYCRNLSDVLMECGFYASHAPDMKQIFYADLLSVDDENLYFKDMESFKKEVGSFLPNIFRAAAEQSKWHIFLNGHGISKTSGASQPSICGFSEENFKKFFHDICMKNIAWICLKSCFLGGPNRNIVSELARRLAVQEQCPNIVLFSASDVSSYSFSPFEIFYQDLCDYAKELNVILCEFNDSATTMAIIGSRELDSQFFSGKDVKKSITNVALRYLDREMNRILTISNWPLILEPDKGFNFYPLIDDELVFYLFDDKAKNVKELKTNGQQILFLDNSIIESIQFNKKIPVVLSIYPDSSAHLVKKIDAHDFDLEIKDFFKKFFMDYTITVGCSKEFLIKELVLGNVSKKYFNIYANLFYDEVSNFFVTEIVWQDFSGKIFFCRYKYNNEDDLVKDGAKREWVERDFYELTKKDIVSFKKKFEETERLVAGGCHV